ncbi:MAG TPA: DUF1152 domain-containing protein [Gemmatimonadaceae bacterium]|nr:DUF1152 domain-containing protein [Gemmatimonadaceae bacterium]
MTLDLQLPITTALAPTRSVLLAGAGGGADVLAALPLYGALYRAGKAVHLASVSSAPFESTAKVLGPALVRVTAGTATQGSTFPELQLARWFAQREQDVPIYCFDRTGAKPLRRRTRRSPNSFVSTPSCWSTVVRTACCGDEPRLGTPEEDAASLAAAASLPLPVKILVSVGLGVETFHGITDASVLAAIAAFAKRGDFLGAWSLVAGTADVEDYESAVAFALRDRFSTSIVNSSVISAIRGEFGDYHATARTSGSTLAINPLMALYWAFRLDGVAERNLYLDRIRETETFAELQLAIERFRHLRQDIRREITD